MEKLLSLSAETKILLPDFRWWAQKDVDYRGNVFPDPTNPCVNALLSLKVNCNSASSQLTLRPEPPTQAPERLSSFGTTGRSTSNVEYMAAPSWFLTHMSSTGTKTNSAACKILYKDHDNKAVNKNIFYLMFFYKDTEEQTLQILFSKLVRRKKFESWNDTMICDLRTWAPLTQMFQQRWTWCCRDRPWCWHMIGASFPLLFMYSSPF